MKKQKCDNPLLKLETKAESKESFYDSFRKRIILFFDMAIRSIIMFLGVIILFFIVTSIFKWNIPQVWIFVTAFLLSLVVSPYLTKIQLADPILTKYEEWLKKMMK